MPLPISIKQAKATATWLKTHFSAEMAAVATTPPIDADVLCAIACQEAACYWLEWTTHLSPAEVLAHCVFDASGDVQGAPRTAKPVNTAQCRKDFGDAFTDDMIAEANAMRALRGMKPAKIVYKGYGFLQYDLQYAYTDLDFFAKHQWRDFTQCARRAVDELNKNYKKYKDLRTAIRAYNGQGAKAEQYAENVMEFLDACRTVTV
jgi:hypothetical protein